MSLPGNAASSSAVQAALLSPDNRDRSDLLLDYELGGVALNDPSGGLQVQPWEAWSDGAHVWVAPSPGRTPTTLLLTGSGITEISFAFDQNMRVTVAYVEAGTTKLFWFDTSVGAMVTTSYAGASSPMLALDDKRPVATLGGSSDVLFFYILGGDLRYRQQRDRFNTERTLATLPPTSTRINRVGMGANNRMQIWAGDVAGTEASAVYTDLLTDTLYTVDSGDVLPLFHGPAETALWRSGVFQTDAQPSMAWAKVEADYPVTVRIYADGELVLAPAPFTSDDPIRLPAIRGAEWFIEVESTGNRVVQVVLASSLAELIGD